MKKVIKANSKLITDASIGAKQDEFDIVYHQDFLNLDNVDWRNPDIQAVARKIVDQYIVLIGLFEDLGGMVE